jgi:hypothetical protein
MSWQHRFNIGVNWRTPVYMLRSEDVNASCNVDGNKCLTHCIMTSSLVFISPPTELKSGSPEE